MAAIGEAYYNSLKKVTAGSSVHTSSGPFFSSLPFILKFKTALARFEDVELAANLPLRVNKKRGLVFTLPSPSLSPLVCLMNSGVRPLRFWTRAACLRRGLGWALAGLRVCTSKANRASHGLGCKRSAGGRVASLIIRFMSLWRRFAWRQGCGPSTPTNPCCGRRAQFETSIWHVPS